MAGPRRALASTERTTPTLPVAHARRIALAAQGFGDRTRPATPARLRATLERLRLLQVDSVNVLVRAHYFPLFSRCGPYDRELLDRLVYEERTWFEYWGHAASLLPVRLQPLLRWRMGRPPGSEVARLLHASPGVADDLVRRIESEGPLSAADLAGDGPRSRGMWNWGPTKHVVEWLFTTGRLAVAGRRRFERVFDLPERVLPHGVLSIPTPDPDMARASLLVESAHALGIGTSADLADYFRLGVSVARPLLARLVADGRLLRTRVEGWRDEAYVPAGVPLEAPPVPARALLSPFDSLIFHRDRTERLFGFRYRIGIYTPAAQREHGYYVLPFLMDEALRARVDLKADRAAGRLLVRTTHLEPGESPRPVARALAGELRLLSSWLGLSSVAVGRRGNLHGALRDAIAGR